MATIQPVVLFFVLGVLAGVMKSDLKIPEALYKSLSIFLLIAIGFKGGVSMAKYEIMEVLPIALSMVVLAALVPLTAYPILKKLGKFSQADAGAIAAHYGSVSAVTFAVGIAFLEGIKETSEGLHGPDHGADGDTGAGNGHGLGSGWSQGYYPVGEAVARNPDRHQYFPDGRWGHRRLLRRDGKTCVAAG